jgi:hypothetical protein
MLFSAHPPRQPLRQRLSSSEKRANGEKQAAVAAPLPRLHHLHFPNNRLTALSGLSRRSENGGTMNMKKFASLLAVAAFALVATPAVRAQSLTELIPGTQVRLTLIDGLSTAVAHDGDPFTAVVSEPVFQGNTIILPAGTRVHGTISHVDRPKMFSLLRGGASMNLNFTSIEVESRIFPARMSILGLYTTTTDASKQRKDLKTVEGVVIEPNRDVKSVVEDVTLGTAGGSLVGIVFSRVVRGTVLGLVGGGAYVVAKKGKDVELPAQTGMLVRMDTTVSLPTSLVHTASEGAE